MTVPYLNLFQDSPHGVVTSDAYPVMFDVLKRHCRSSWTQRRWASVLNAALNTVAQFALLFLALLHDHWDQIRVQP
jgi:hypothetical protein